MPLQTAGGQGTCLALGHALGTRFTWSPLPMGEMTVGRLWRPTEDSLAA